ncbi:MAG TPA: HAD family hydrolase [Cyclobacteriaceae bacterium]|nr:HAD family hydrolase [Cyclobacteriaceae bacterium]
MEQSRRLALFDFDGTITTRDTLMEITKYYSGSAKFYRGLAYLSIPLALQRSGMISAQQAKERFLTYFFSGITLDNFSDVCSRFTSQALPGIIRPGAHEAIDNHKKNNDRVIIVSASPHNWIAPWANSVGIEVIGTRLEVKNGIITGKIEGKNCNGEEKVVRVKQHLELGDYKEVDVYGDTKGDRPMLSLATTPHWKPFR